MKDFNRKEISYYVLFVALCVTEYIHVKYIENKTPNMKYIKAKYYFILVVCPFLFIIATICMFLIANPKI